MLSETTLGFLSTLTYRADAKRQACWLPLSGIYWEDEMPEIILLNIPTDDLHQILRLFSIRVRLWKGVVVSDADQQFWDATYSRVPHWAFFQRKEISADDQNAQVDAEQCAADVLEALLTDANLVSISEKDGVQTFSATFDLTKRQTPPKKKQSWWNRVFRRTRVPRKPGLLT